MAVHINKSSVEWPITGLLKLWRACPKWHAAFSVVPIFFYFFSSATVSILWRICVYIRISDCVQNVYELPLLPNKTANETFLHKSGAVRSVDSRLINRAAAWRWLGEYVAMEKVLQSSFPTGNSNSPKLLPHFLTYRVPLAALIRNIIIILCINYTI
jgi:hypothetical protein